MPQGRTAGQTAELMPLLFHRIPPLTPMNTIPPTRVLVITLNSLAGGGQRAAGARSAEGHQRP